jgi:hypothetical protein
MKNLSGKTLMRGDFILVEIVPQVIQGGPIQQFYDRANQVRFGGYPIPVDAGKTVLASDAFEAYARPMLKKQEDEAATAKATELAAQKAKDEADAKNRDAIQAANALKASGSVQNAPPAVSTLPANQSAPEGQQDATAGS